MATYRVRPAIQADGSFLGDMVCEAANWRPGSPRPRHDILAAPEHGRYISGWMRPGDAGFVAVDLQDQPVGAAWYRMFPRSDPGFGWVGTGVPELIIGVRPIWRAHGVGRALMASLADRARKSGFARLSLSVDRDNFATSLYRSEGFVVVRAGMGRDVMVNRLR